MLDGLFQQALLAYADGGEDVLQVLTVQVGEVLPMMLTAPSSTLSPG